jgi:hypothetical protein
MKNKFLIVAFGILSSCGICEDDDQRQDDSDIIGNYRMTSWNAPLPTDLNQDGIASRNFMSESMCYNGTLEISADHTFILDYHYAESVSGSLSCFDSYTTGTWERTGTVLHLTDTLGQTTDYAFGTVNRVLTRSETSWPYPTSEGNQTGPINMVFAMQ